MTLETPLWVQGGTYPARLDRQFLEEVMRRQNRVFRGLTVTQRAAGPNFSVDVSLGAAFILCTSALDAGGWYCRNTATFNIGGVDFPPTPGVNRTDTVLATVNDPNAGGAPGNNWVLRCIAGTVLPANSIPLATIARTPGEPSILNAAITDVAARGEWPWTVGSSPPTGRGVPGDLYVVC